MRENPPKTHLEWFLGVWKRYGGPVAMATEWVRPEGDNQSVTWGSGSFFDWEVNQPSIRSRRRSWERPWGDDEGPTAGLSVKTAWSEFLAAMVQDRSISSIDKLDTYILAETNSVLSLEVDWEGIHTFFKALRRGEFLNPIEGEKRFYLRWANAPVSTPRLDWVAKSINYAWKKASRGQPVFKNDGVVFNGYAVGTRLDPHMDNAELIYEDNRGEETFRFDLQFHDEILFHTRGERSWKPVRGSKGFVEFAKMFHSMDMNMQPVVDYLEAKDINPLQERLSWEQVCEDSRAWHIELAEREGQPEKMTEGELVLELPDGMTVWWLQEVSDFETEGYRMGHCIGEGGERSYYYTRSRRGEKSLASGEVPATGSMRSFSFRDPTTYADTNYGAVSITYSVQGGGWILHQAKGPDNSHPGQDVWEALTAFHDYMRNAKDLWCLVPEGIHPDADEDLDLDHAITALMLSDASITRREARGAVMESLGFLSR